MQVKRYTLKVEEVGGVMSMNSRSDGFNAFELLGILYHKAHDIEKQLADEVKPDIIKREVIEETK